MSLKPDYMDIEDLKGVIFTFENKGDILARHTHDEGSAHVTIVARGSFRVIFDNNGEVIMNDVFSEGHLIDTPAGIYHEFISLEDNSRIYNIVKKALKV